MNPANQSQPPRRARIYPVQQQPLTRQARLLRPFITSERGLERFVNWLGSLAIFQLLEYAGRLTVLVAVIFYFVEAPERRKQAQYQAWQLINSAQGQTGSGGRIEALQDLNKNQVSLAGVAAPKAYLAEITLHRADLFDADLQGADLSGADLSEADLFEASLQGADLSEADLHGASLWGASLQGAYLPRANLQGADLQGANLGGANLGGASLGGANLGGANLGGATLHGTDLRGAIGLSVNQIKAATNWEQATYDDLFRAELGLPPATNQTPQP